MTAAWRKAFRDFWQEGTRTVLVVLAIAMGIASFGAVLSTYAILTRELNAGYRATNPASATLWTDRADDELLSALRSNPQVGAVEARRTVSGRIKAAPGEWRGLTLFVVKDYGSIRISRIEPQRGAWPPAAGEMLIERDALQVARARIGDTVTVKTSRGNEQTLRVSGTVHDVGQAQARMENIVYGYITQDTLPQLGEEASLDQLKIVVAGDRFDEGHVRTAAGQIRQWVEGRGHPVRRMEVPIPGKHPHADIMGLLLLAQASFGLFALALSGILVVNLLTALMGSQIRQIGVMKAIGATRRQIARIYFVQALLLGTAAIAVAIPVAIVGGRVLCRSMAVFLNFDIRSFTVPPWVFLLEAAAGLVLPLLAAAYPVMKGSRISVREALADYGIGRDTFGAGALDRILAGRSGLVRPILLAVRNSFRRRARLALTLVTLAAGGIFFLSALNIRASMIHTLDRLFDLKKFDLSVNLGAMVPFDKVERAIRKTPGVLRAEGWIVTEGALPGPGDGPSAGGASPGASHAKGRTGGGHGGGVPTGDRFAVIALPVETRFLELDIVVGRGLRTGDTNALVVNTSLAAKGPQFRVGNEVTLRMGPSEMSWRVVGQAREPFSPAVAYIPLAYIERLGGHEGMANSVRLVLDRKGAASITDVRAGLDRNLELEGLRALGSASKADSRFSFDQHMLMISVFLIVVSCLLAGVGGLGLMTTMSLNVMERRREMGVLRAIGASPSAVRSIVVAEGAVIGLLGWALAALAAWPVSKAVGDLLVRVAFKSGLDFAFEPLGLVVWLAISVALAAIASFLPAWQASRLPVREAIGYE
jgi:putative ABC transport system permease protein